MILKKLLTASLLIIIGFAYAETKSYTLDPFHTAVTWRISHFGFSYPSGKWMVESGVINLDENNLNKSNVVATIQIDTINSGIPKLDSNLIGKEFFNADEFPTATFISTKVKQKSANKLVVVGNLTVHGVTKPVTLDVTINKIGVHPIMIKKMAGFSATAKINRSDYGMKAYLPGLGDEVDLAIEAEAVINQESAAK